jgi:ribosomal-protein-alanine N-acetyltransferase
VEWEKVTIQKMDIQDLDEVLSIESPGSGALWSKNMFIEEMRNPFAYCFVMKIQDRSKQRVIGFICFRNLGEESELLNICVHSDYRQLGAGKKLMEFYVEFGSRKGITTFHLEVHSSNHSAIRLYQLFSYESSGMRKNFYQGKFDALLMTRRA